ncbi:helix-turn-helix domain-containing protein [Novosphingobium malaysiense]|uniref:XRE family transcriptional regulator n=1 Tax=Novosphingobium malaysiense TaxID=1348853 RepID=A0A0B1ZEI8_9SPHN|nr:helix-turn-helix domain-containing protein [Novosphingobium malaysiense]KHK88935.1 XRE family transcriptional regulator [Novosphingobium malaysiense]
MSRYLSAQSGHELLDEMKLLSGRTIEERRKHARITQRQLAGTIGIGARWIREIEAGNPRSTIDLHIKCAAALGLPVSYLLVPLLFMESDMKFPVGFIVDHFAGLKDHTIKCIGDYYLETLGKQVRPAGDHPPSAAGT